MGTHNGDAAIFFVAREVEVNTVQILHRPGMFSFTLLNLYIPRVSFDTEETSIHFSLSICFLKCISYAQLVLILFLSFLCCFNYLSVVS